MKLLNFRIDLGISRLQTILFNSVNNKWGLNIIGFENHLFQDS